MFMAFWCQVTWHESSKTLIFYELTISSNQLTNSLQFPHEPTRIQCTMVTLPYVWKHVHVCTYLRLLFCAFSNCSRLLASVAIGLCLVVLVPLLHGFLSHRTEPMKQNKILSDTALTGIYMRILTLRPRYTWSSFGVRFESSNQLVKSEKVHPGR